MNFWIIMITFYCIYFRIDAHKITSALLLQILGVYMFTTHHNMDFMPACFELILILEITLFVLLTSNLSQIGFGRKVV